MQPVGHGQVASPAAVNTDPGGVRANVLGTGIHHLHPGDPGGVQQRCLQGCAAHAPAGAMPKHGIDDPAPIGVPDAADGLPLRLNPELAQAANGSRHQALAAGFVDGTGTGLEHDGAQPGPRRVQGGGQPGRSRADDDEVGVDHRATAVEVGAGGGVSASAQASAAFSDEIRTRSSPALATVKQAAVIHAVCTSGRAMPSTATAT